MISHQEPILDLHDGAPRPLLHLSGSHRHLKSLSPMEQLLHISLAVLFLSFVVTSRAASAGTAFTYQGHLNEGRQPASGTYDFLFSLYNASTNGTQISSNLVVHAVEVTNGLFNALVDLGDEAFTGGERWLEIGVRTTPPPWVIKAPFVTLVPRQRITPTPYALSAAAVDSDSTGPLDLSVNGTRGLRLESTSYRVNYTMEIDSGVNVIGGFQNNNASNVVGATIAGGGYNLLLGLNQSDHPNTVTANFGTVGGGTDNTAGLWGTVPGGDKNSALGYGSFAAGREANANHAGSFVWNDGLLPASSTGKNRFEVHATGGTHLWVGTNAVFSDSQKGFALPGSDLPIITRGFDQFGPDAPAPKLALGRWGLFMEPYNLVLGMPSKEIGERNVAIGSYRTDGTWDAMFTVRNTDGMAWAEGRVNCAALTVRGDAELAAPFAMSEAQIDPGSVVVIDENNPGKLRLSTEAYDRKVAGVVSGAGGAKTGISMIPENALEAGQNVALSGRVYVWVRVGPMGKVRPGDLLTTSGVPGQAMVATDQAKAQGAILGKAMEEASGAVLPTKQLVLVLVTLQ
jgi:hypothetical protein